MARSLLAIPCKICNEQSLAALHDGWVHPLKVSEDTEFSGFSDSGSSSRCGKKRFAGHAAAQDAQASDLFAALNHCSLQSLARTKRCGGVPSASSSDHDKVEFQHECGGGN